MRAKKKMLLVFGTRPEAIKMAPLVEEFRNEFAYFETCVAVTGQHREMLDQVLDLFGICPDYDLDIMTPGQDLYDVTSRVLLGMRHVLDECRPDCVLVHGDTTTSTASALAAFYHRISVAHIEAGLRTGERYSPWPEELNRQLTARIASFHFAPTDLSRENLLRENIPDDRIWVTGNTVIDTLARIVEKMEKNVCLRNEAMASLIASGLPGHVVDSWGKGRRFALITGHRRENFGQGFLRISQAIAELASRYPDVDFVYPLHLNPNVREPVLGVFADISMGGNLFFIDPLSYLPFVFLMSMSHFVLTDSGGIQEEAPGLGKPVLVMRETTERPEAIEAGTVRLVGTDPALIVSAASRLLDDSAFYAAMSKANNPYGDGRACERIVEVLRSTGMLDQVSS